MDLGRGYNSLWEKSLPSTNPSSNRFGLRWEITACWCLMTMDLLDFEHPWTFWSAILPSSRFWCPFGASSPLPVQQASQKATLKGLWHRLAYQRDILTVGSSLNETFSQFCATYGQNSVKFTARQDNSCLEPEFLVKKVLHNLQESLKGTTWHRNYRWLFIQPYPRPCSHSTKWTDWTFHTKMKLQPQFHHYLAIKPLNQSTFNFCLVSFRAFQQTWMHISKSVEVWKEKYDIWKKQNKKKSTVLKGRAN